MLLAVDGKLAGIVAVADTFKRRFAAGYCRNRSDGYQNSNDYWR